jgi:hydroxycarboxylate dehydrogenase B
MKGVAVPEGSVYDAEGQPSTDPNVLEQGGSLAPFGEHKGYGLALICELLGGGLAGEWTMQDVDKQTDMTINHMLEFIIDPNLFGGLEAFQEEVEGMSRWLQESKPAVGNDRVRLPGEPERESMRMRTANGIPLDDGSWGSIIKAAQIAGMSDETIKSLTE